MIKLVESIKIQQKKGRFFKVLLLYMLGMDYEGFRQMVLGANLFNLKTN